MKKICLLPLLAFTMPTFAAPYIGFEMGSATPNHDINFVDSGEKLSLTPDSKDLFLGVKAGYVFDKTWSVEAGYHQHQFTQAATVDKGKLTSTEARKYSHLNTALESSQFYLTPIYSLSLTNDRLWNLKLRAGVSYTKYEFSGSKSEQLLHSNGGASHTTSVFDRTKTSSDIGFIAGVGVEYKLMSEMGVGANFNYQADSYSNMNTLAIYANYYF